MIQIFLIALILGLVSGYSAARLITKSKDLPERLRIYTSEDQPFLCSVVRYQIGNLHFIDAIENGSGRCEIRIQAPSPEQAEKEFFKYLRNRGGYEYFPGGK